MSDCFIRQILNNYSVYCLDAYFEMRRCFVAFSIMFDVNNIFIRTQQFINKKTKHRNNVVVSTETPFLFRFDRTTRRTILKSFDMFLETLRFASNTLMESYVGSKRYANMRVKLLPPYVLRTASF